MILMDDTVHTYFSSKDILMRVIAQNLSASSTLVETVYLNLVLYLGLHFSCLFLSLLSDIYSTQSQVMTANPECAIIDTPIVDALHIMHNGKFLHLPVVDRGNILAWDGEQVYHWYFSDFGFWKQMALLLPRLMWLISLMLLWPQLVRYVVLSMLLQINCWNSCKLILPLIGTSVVVKLKVVFKLYFLWNNKCQYLNMYAS